MKGQIGIEYLVIFAIALVLLIIVVGQVLRMFTETSYTPKCTSDNPLIVCADNVFALTKNSTGNNLVASVRLLNGNQRDIQVLSAACYSGKQAPSGLRYVSISGTPIVRSQGSGDITNIPCVDQNNQPIQFSAGAGFDGTFEIVYKFTDDIVSNRTVRLFLTGRVG
ncbi:MAG: hypothetical protein QXE47_02365 [Candidatus Anstonellales archaeon]